MLESNCDSAKVTTVYERLQKVSNAEKSQEIKWEPTGNQNLTKQIFLLPFFGHNHGTQKFWVLDRTFATAVTTPNP